MTRPARIGDPQISVCIATHKRPEGLRRLLGSLAAQTGAPSFEVVVIDNDAAASGRPVAEGFSGRLDLTYGSEPVRGIARARNRAVAGSRGAFLAFIDDDTWAAPLWLATLAATAEEQLADVVIGRVTPCFHDDVPDYIRRCSMFSRSPPADGETVPWYLTCTNNSYVRRSALPEPGAPFAHRFDLTGGEDIDLFSRMIDHGARVVAAARAEAFEERPARRANLRWVLRRSLRNGANAGAAEAGRMSAPRRFAFGLAPGSHGIAYGVLGAMAWAKDRRAAADHLINMAYEIGRLAGCLGFRVEEYRRHP
jgi:glycosyltransferase involved in cell wall biosynthesis